MSDRRSLAFAALTVVWLFGLELLGVEAALAYLAPALLILLPLLGGRYPGDEALVRAPPGGPARRAGTRRRQCHPPAGRPTGCCRAAAGSWPPRSPAAARPPRSQPERTDSRRARRNDEHDDTGGGRDRRAHPRAGGQRRRPHHRQSGRGALGRIATVSFQVGHGCEESPTTQLRIQIPPSVPSVTPSVHPLWDVATKEGKKDKVELHGETITERVSEVVYTAKQPLPPDRLASFRSA